MAALQRNTLLTPSIGVENHQERGKQLKWITNSDNVITLLLRPIFAETRKEPSRGFLRSNSEKQTWFQGRNTLLKKRTM